VRRPGGSAGGQELVVANQNSVLVFQLPLVSPIAPSQDITSNAVTGAYGVSVGPSGALFATVAQSKPSPAMKFAAAATGNVGPIQQIQIYLYEINGIVVDSSGDIITGSWTIDGDPRIDYFASTARGYATPIKTIEGPGTELGMNPASLALDASNDLWVTQIGLSTSLGGYLLEFSPTASGAATPKTMIYGNKTGLVYPQQVCIDNSSFGAGRIIVADSSGHVLVYKPNATGNAAPVQNITTVASPDGVATDSAGQIYVSKPNTNEILVFGKNATGSASPISKITGAGSLLSHPGQLFITSLGSSS
jgi:hypothetical protein